MVLPWGRCLTLCTPVRHRTTKAQISETHAGDVLGLWLGVEGSPRVRAGQPPEVVDPEEGIEQQPTNGGGLPDGTSSHFCNFAHLNWSALKGESSLRVTRCGSRAQLASPCPNPYTAASGRDAPIVPYDGS